MRPLYVLMLAVPLVAAGCVTPPAELDAAAAELETTPAPIEEAFSFDGQFGVGAGACPMITCVGHFTMTNSATQAEFAGTLTGATLTLTWDARPGEGGMYLGMWWGEEDEEGDYEYVEGASPLVLELTDLEIPDDKEVWIWAWPVGPAMGFVDVMTPQSFKIEGTLTSVPATAAEPQMPSETA